MLQYVTCSFMVDLPSLLHYPWIRRFWIKCGESAGCHDCVRLSWQVSMQVYVEFYWSVVVILTILTQFISCCTARHPTEDDQALKTQMQTYTHTKAHTKSHARGTAPGCCCWRYRPQTIQGALVFCLGFADNTCLCQKKLHVQLRGRRFPWE